jgi:stage II sporulation protein D
MRTRTPRILLTLLAGFALLAPTTPATAAPSDNAVTLGTATSLKVTGHGFGHGRGMSQYGAQGAARDGLTYAQILAFYYPGTQLSVLSAGIRVLITGDTDNNTTVKHMAGLRVVDRGTGQSYRLRTATTPRAWRLKTVYGKTRVYYRTASWHLFRTDGRRALAGAGEFRSTAGPIGLKLPSGVVRYRGGLRFVNSDTVNVVSLENYLKGVVPSEMPPSWKPAALQSQAVAARTYAARARADNLKDTYQICDTTACQVYKGYDNETSTTNAAISATAGRILTYQGTPAFAQFSSSSGGWTAGGTEPYLVSKQDPYDRPVVDHIGDPNFSWTASVSVARLRAAYGPGLTSIQVMQRENSGTAAEWGGRALVIALHGSHGDKTYTGDSKIRGLLGVKSSYVQISLP